MADDDMQENDRSETDMREVTIPVTAVEQSLGRVSVTLKYPKNINNAEVMENVLGIAIQELQNNPDIVEKFVETRTKFHEAHSDNLRQLELNRQNIELQLRLDEEKTKRLGIVLSTFLVALGLVAILFYPDGRENMVYPIAAALFVCAAGAFGYKRLWGKTHGFEGMVERD